MGADLMYLFGPGSSSTSSPGSGSSQKPKPARKVRTRIIGESHHAENVQKDEDGDNDDMFITWPESRPLPCSRSNSPDSSGSESSYSSTLSNSTISLPDYHSPNGSTREKRIPSSSRSKVQGIFRPSARSRSQSEPVVGRGRSSSSASSFMSSATTLVDRSENELDGGKEGLRISVEVEYTTHVSGQAKWELDLDVPRRSTGGLRRNGPGGKGDRWNGNWV